MHGIAGSLWNPASPSSRALCRSLPSLAAVEAGRAIPAELSQARPQGYILMRTGSTRLEGITRGRDERTEEAATWSLQTLPISA